MDAPKLDLRYVGREIVPARTRRAAVYSNGQARTEFVRLDLLLTGDLLIPGEVKIAGDKDAFVALVQVLMLAAELVTPSQRERLRRAYGARLTGLADQRVDVYLIFDRYPISSRVKGPILVETERIAREFLGCGCVRPYIRRVAGSGKSGIEGKSGIPVPGEIWGRYNRGTEFFLDRYAYRDQTSGR